MFVRTTGVILLKGAIEYNLGKTDRDIKNLEERKEIYQGIRIAVDQLFKRPQEDVINMTNEDMH